MCFYNDDYDWYAQVTEVTESDSGPTTSCGECGCKIAEHEWRKHIHQQQYEDCLICQDPFSDEFIKPEDRPVGFDCKHNYGESYDYDCCRACENFLLAIEAREKDEGCPEHARRPPLGMLHEEMQEHEQAAEYGKRAVEMFPELMTHRLIQVALAGKYPNV